MRAVPDVSRAVPRDNRSPRTAARGNPVTRNAYYPAWRFQGLVEPVSRCNAIPVHDTHLRRPALIAGQGGHMSVDEQRLNAFLGKAVGDLGAAVSAVLVSIGDELG